MNRKRRALVLVLAVVGLLALAGGVASAYPHSSGMGHDMMGSSTTTPSGGPTSPAPGPGWCWDDRSGAWVPPTTTTNPGTTPTTVSTIPPSPGPGWCWDDAAHRWYQPATVTTFPTVTTPPGAPSTPPPGDAPAGSPGDFTDVPMGCWYGPAVTDLAGRGVIGGFADGTFRGDLSISRAQFAAMMGRMMGVQPGGQAPFPDVRGTWAEGWIAAMSQRGIMQGYPDGTFGPDQLITRAQCAAFVARALGLPDDWTGPVQFPDLAGTWACGYIHQLWQQGIVSGYRSGMFGPDDEVSRAQAAAMLWRCGGLAPFAAR